MRGSAAGLGLRHPVESPVHRLPAGLKLGLLAVLGIGLTWLGSPAAVAVVLVVLVLVVPLARVPARVAWRQVRPVLVLLVVIGAVQVLTDGWGTAFTVVGGILALVLGAALVTLTTTTEALTDVLVRLCRPLRRVGVDPERVGLAVALGIRAVPVVVGLAAEVRDAQHARGLAASPRAFAVPLVVRSLRHADGVAEALAARGLDD